MIQIIKALDPDYYARFRASNVYKYLCAPLGHEYLLDIRVDVDGIGRALFCGWRGEGHPFSARDAKAVEPVCAFAHQAFISARDTVAWQSIGSRTAHFITDASGTRLIGIDDEAEALLRAGHLLRQNISLQDDQRAAPSFARALSAQLECGLTAEITLPVATGRLAMKAVRSNIRTHQNEAIQMMVTVDLQQAIDVSVIELLSTLPLTMLQKKIALFAAQGELRRNCEVRFDVSPEALKKHLNAIYLATDTQSWGELASLAIKVN